MLILTRKGGEKIVIGDNITITLLSHDKGRVRIGIEAPPEQRVVRDEILQRQKGPRQIDPTAAS